MYLNILLYLEQKINSILKKIFVEKWKIFYKFKEIIFLYTMNFQKTICGVLSFLLFVPALFAAEIVEMPKDVVPQDSAYDALVDFISEGIFTGVNGEANLDNVISKQHAALFLAKVRGIQNPTFDDVAALKILTVEPKSDELLNYATWTKMLCNGFNVPNCESPDPAGWFVPGMVIATSINAIEDVKPFDFVSRRDVFRMAHMYRNIFLSKTVDEMMDNQERNLMRLRDMMLDVTITNAEIEKLLWDNIVAAEKTPDNVRVESIRHLNMALLVLFQKRQQPTNSLLQERALFFLQKAVATLPDVAGFAGDLQKIAEQ